MELEAVVRQATPAQAECVGSLVYELLSELYPELGYAREKCIEVAVTLGRERGWPDIEVGAPSVPAWQRTVDFYLGCGFEEVGPRLDLRIRSAG